MKKLISFLLILLVQGSAFSQTLSLEDAINIALKKSLDLQLLKNDVEISRVNNNIGIAGGLPTVNVSGSDNQTANNVNQHLNTGTVIKRNGAVGNSFSSDITGEILLYNGSRVVATKHRLEQLELQSRQYLNAEVQNTMAAVMVSYYDIVRQQDFIRTIDQSIIVAQKQLDVVKVQQSVGFANNADLFQSQITLNSLVQQREAQVLVVEQAKTGLLLLLNLKADSVINIRDTILIDKSLVLGNILDGLASNADVLAAENQISINQFIVKETAAQRYPSVLANAGYNYNRNQTTAGNILLNQNSGPFAGVTLGIPIYNGSVFRRQKRVAEINVESAYVQKGIITRNYSAQAVQNYQAYISSLKQVDTQRVNVDLTRKLIDLSLLRFQYHQATIVELTQAQQSFQQASNVLTNLSFAAKSAEIELKRLANQLKF